MTIPTETMITEWRLDPKGHAGEIRKIWRQYQEAERVEKQLNKIQGKLNGTIDDTGKKAKKSATALTSASNATKTLSKSSKKLGASLSGVAIRAGALGAAVGGIGIAAASMLEAGQSVNKLWQANSLSIDMARESTQGLISDQELLKASNKSVAFDLGFTERQFADLAKGAVVASQKIGGDVPKAIDDLMTGMARQSRLILDNLGIMVKTGDANKAYAAQLGKTAKELTEAEKKQAFMNAAIKDLKRIAGSTKLEVADLGGAYSQFKIAADNAKTAASRFFASLVVGKSKAAGVAEWLNEVAGHLNRMSDPRTRKKIQLTEQLAEMTPQIEKFKNEIDFARREWIKGESFFRTDAKLAEAISFYNKYTSLQRRFTDIRVGQEKEAQKKEYNAWAAGQRRLAAEQIAAYDAQTGKLKKAATKRRKQISSVFQNQGPARPEGIGKTGEHIGEFAPKFGPSIELVGRAPELFNRATSAAQSLGFAMAEVFSGFDAGTEKFDVFQQKIVAVANDIQDTGVNAFASFGAAIWGAADAAIQGSEQFGIAVLKALKSTLLALAQEATFKALFALAEYALSGFTDASKLTAALLYGAVAVAAGGAGLAVSAGVASASSGSEKKKTTTTAAKTQQFGKAVEDKRAVNVNVYINDPLNPSQQFIAKRQVEASISQAVTVSS